jgi:putative transcriptional regulator
MPKGLYQKFLTSPGPLPGWKAVGQYESNVREYRQRKGLSQEALAREVGVSRQTIVNIERGEDEPKVLLALALAAVLGVAIEHLFKKGLL